MLQTSRSLCLELPDGNVDGDAVRPAVALDAVGSQLGQGDAPALAELFVDAAEVVSKQGQVWERKTFRFAVPFDTHCGPADKAGGRKLQRKSKSVDECHSGDERFC